MAGVMAYRTCGACVVSIAQALMSTRPNGSGPLPKFAVDFTQTLFPRVSGDGYAVVFGAARLASELADTSQILAAAKMHLHIASRQPLNATAAGQGAKIAQLTAILPPDLPIAVDDFESLGYALRALASGASVRLLFGGGTGAIREVLLHFRQLKLQEKPRVFEMRDGPSNSCGNVHLVCAIKVGRTTPEFVTAASRRFQGPYVADGSCIL